MTRTRLVLDSVFYFSLALRGKIATRIWQLVLSQDEIELCLSAPHFNEIKAKLYGEQMRQLLGNQYNENLMGQICAKIAASHTHFYPQVQIDLCSDRDDNFLLELAATCKADFLITNDKQLLKLNPFEKTQIIKVGDFLNLLEGDWLIKQQVA
jgi:uncharacterized protein